MARWSVYLVRCRGGSLYTGIATDVSRRLEQHRRGRGEGAKFLRGKGPLTLVLDRAIGGKGLALRIESSIKKLPKARKEMLVAHDGMLGEIVARARKAIRGNNKGRSLSGTRVSGLTRRTRGA